MAMVSGAAFELCLNCSNLTGCLVLLYYVSLLFLDSLKVHRKERVAKMTRKWLNFEWNRSMKHAEGFRRDPFSKKHMKLVTPKGVKCFVALCFELFLD